MSEQRPESQVARADFDAVLTAGLAEIQAIADTGDPAWITVPKQWQSGPPPHELCRVADEQPKGRDRAITFSTELLVPAGEQSMPVIAPRPIVVRPRATVLPQRSRTNFRLLSVPSLVEATAPFAPDAESLGNVAQAAVTWANRSYDLAAGEDFSPAALSEKDAAHRVVTLLIGRSVVLAELGTAAAEPLMEIFRGLGTERNQPVAGLARGAIADAMGRLLLHTSNVAERTFRGGDYVGSSDSTRVSVATMAEAAGLLPDRFWLDNGVRNPTMFTSRPLMHAVLQRLRDPEHPLLNDVASEQRQYEMRRYIEGLLTALKDDPRFAPDERARLEAVARQTGYKYADGTVLGSMVRIGNQVSPRLQERLSQREGEAVQLAVLDEQKPAHAPEAIARILFAVINPQTPQTRIDSLEYQADLHATAIALLHNRIAAGPSSADRRMQAVRASEADIRIALAERDHPTVPSTVRELYARTVRSSARYNAAGFRAKQPGWGVVS